MAHAKEALAALATQPSFTIFAELPNFKSPRIFIKESLKRLEEIKFSEPTDVLIYDRSELIRVIDKYHPDVVFSDSDIGVLLQEYRHYDPLLSFTSSVSKSPSAMAGSLFFVKDDSEFQKLEDLSGELLGRLSEANMSSWKVAVGEVTMLGLDPHDFFKRLKTYRNETEMAEALKAGEIKGGILAACGFERIPANLRNGFRPIQPRKYNDLACMVTTMVYPSWLLSVSSNVSNEDREKIREALLNFTTSDVGAKWNPPEDLRDVMALLKRTNDDLYQQYQHSNWYTRLLKYWWILVVLLLGGVFLLIHDRIVSRLVAKKEKQLKAEISQRMDLEEKLQAWEKANTIGIMSSMISHELKQPLATIKNYAMSIRERLKANKPVSENILQMGLAKILSQTQRTIEIIDHVRQYSKGMHTTCQTVNVSQVVEETVRSLSSGKLSSIQVTKNIQPDIVMKIDPFELQICLRNLLKNALEALADAPDPKLTITLKGHSTRSFCLTVEDNGKALTDEQLKLMQRPLQSTKAQGLGLGLSIIRKIAEKYKGSLIIERVEPKGVKFRVSFHCGEMTCGKEGRCAQ